MSGEKYIMSITRSQKNENIAFVEVNQRSYCPLQHPPQAGNREGGQGG